MLSFHSQLELTRGVPCAPPCALSSPAGVSAALLARSRGSTSAGGGTSQGWRASRGWRLPTAASGDGRRPAAGSGAPLRPRPPRTERTPPGGHPARHSALHSSGGGGGAPSPSAITRFNGGEPCWGKRRRSEQLKRGQHVDPAEPAQVTGKASNQIVWQRRSRNGRRERTARSQSAPLPRPLRLHLPPLSPPVLLNRLPFSLFL